MQEKFRIGLTMAGAVSAGAYTGGVVDYLFQVLDAWEKAKQSGDPSVPTHDVMIDIISGASAGGITGGMATLAAYMENRFPVTPDKRNDNNYLEQNVFYNAWVNLLQDDMIPLLLETGDIKTNGKAVSLMNSDFIEKIAERTIIQLPEYREAPPPYISPVMQLVLTLSNLNGFRYSLSFEGSSSHHFMQQHRDYAFFRMGDIYDGLGRIPLDVQKNVGLTELKQACTATGAFPIGLAYRQFIRKTKHITDNTDLVVNRVDITGFHELEGKNPEDDYITYNVDGGMLNNEPFDLTMKLMAKTSVKEEVAEKGILETSEKTFDSTIIMIDPFPSEDSVEGTEKQKKSSGSTDRFPYSLLQVLKRIYSTMRGELLFKGDDIIAAFNEKNFSRFMISPKRRDGDKTYNGSVAIACGALDGFAGFFSKDFRRHDFFLGKVNCQSFIRKHFAVKLINGKPVNPLFARGYSTEAIERFKFQDEDELKKIIEQSGKPEDAQWYIPIIPDLYKDDMAYDEKALPYPKFNMADFEKHKSLLINRSRQLLKSLIGKTWLRLLLLFMFNVLIKNRLYNIVRKTIEEQFQKWKLI